MVGGGENRPKTSPFRLLFDTPNSSVRTGHSLLRLEDLRPPGVRTEENHDYPLFPSLPTRIHPYTESKCPEHDDRAKKRLRRMGYSKTLHTR